MKKLKFFALWGILIAGIGCGDQLDGSDINPDGLGEPDKVIENVTGMLYYVEVINQWAIQYHFPETIDSVDLYLLNDFDAGDTPTDAMVRVKISGRCYKSTETLAPVPAGTNVYRIVITDLIYE
jgi:hypothetical protein